MSEYNSLELEEMVQVQSLKISSNNGSISETICCLLPTLLTFLIWHQYSYTGGTAMYPSPPRRAPQNAGCGANAGRWWPRREMGAMAWNGEPYEQGSTAPTEVLRTCWGFFMGHRSHSLVRAQIAAHQAFFSPSSHMKICHLDDTELFRI